MLPETYKKVIVKQFSHDPHQAMEVVDEKMYPPGPNEILVKNRYCGANFTDVPRMMGFANRFQIPPFDAGIDALGEVLGVGSSVTDFKIGDHVVTAFFGNGFREYSLIDARLAVVTVDSTPERLGLVISGTMASIMLNVVAGYNDTTPKQTILVTAGLGDSGHYMVQLAKLQGHYVISTCANDDEAKLLQALGCDRIIIRDKDDLETIIADEYPAGINLVLESFGGKFFEVGLKSLAPRGRMIASGALFEHTKNNGTTHEIDVYNNLILKSATLHGFNLVEYAHHISHQAGKIRELHQAGKIKTLIDPTKFKGIDNVIDAVAHMMSWKTRGKVIVEL